MNAITLAHIVAAEIKKLSARYVNIAYITPETIAEINDELFKAVRDLIPGDFSLKVYPSKVDPYKLDVEIELHSESIGEDDDSDSEDDEWTSDFHRD